MKIIADLHCHTIASSHAFSTIIENVNEAHNKGLFATAITDHTGDIPGAPDSWYFSNLKILPHEINKVKIMKGIECNILDRNGTIDLPKDIGYSLDLVIASVHDKLFERERNIEILTQTYINLAKNKNVDIIGHSGTPGFFYDLDKVIPIFKKYNKLVEINASSPRVRGEKSKENCIKIAESCKKYEVNVVVNSDAHFCEHVGRFDMALEILKSIDFPEKLIINADIDRLKNHFKCL